MSANRFVEWGLPRDRFMWTLLVLADECWRHTLKALAELGPLGHHHSIWMLSCPRLGLG